MGNLIIKTRREHRFITALLCKGAVTRYRMDGICGAANSPEVKRQLKDRGWPIGCQRFEVIDRDGQKTYPGRYYFSDKIDAKTLKMVRNWDGGCES